ncbi:MAG: nitrite reductase [Epsilonproteobacteria bacterium]|uniref:Nitrite reductase n=1 Tax=Sulfurospirillum cavolei TaxID=366522 RepID=A0A2D3WCZ6_9BACT|nr:MULTISPECIES: NrfD/PsrC family molybdoenzyme membrane anchor subunit [Sulfurospirillum]MCP3651489.1 polysulfide reductase NrfD [Sulfurospirillum sp. DNRA8]MCR1810336.1 polysulfide reductase NrfD [Sulfurospirillum sp. DNRA8]NCB55596.1 nitrite reductase [Campylobacterota bacterium]DAB36607.1 MAG TPA: nitrite reductase [Sulfurospirillum cavolei]
MNEAIEFTVGFSHGVEWGWPIGVYLLLAGISGGALIVSLALRYYQRQSVETPLLKAASLVSFVTIVFGMVFLVGDLEKPLYFWKILINYNFKSVMSIGVLALCLYIPLTFVLVAIVFEGWIKEHLATTPLAKLFFLFPLLKALRPAVEVLAFVFAIVVCAYTGFLISVLVRFPLLNTAILPALFVVSGLSAGTAFSSLIASFFFQADAHAGDMKTLHTIEWPVMALEMLLLFMLFVSLIVGTSFDKQTAGAFFQGGYSALFWFGVVGIGFGVPLVLNFLLGKKVAHSAFAFYLSGAASVLGVLSLRLFILYAGQTFSA